MIGRKTSLAIMNLIVGVVLGLVAQKLIALYIKNVYFGQVLYALGTLGLVFFITELGMGQAHVKRVSEGRHAGDCFATYAVFKLASTGFFVALVLGGLWFYMGYLGKPLETTTLPVLFIILTYYVAKSIQEIGQSSFEARLEMARLQVTSFSDTIVRVILSMVAAFIVGAIVFGIGPLAGRLDPNSALAAYVRENPAVPLAIATAAGAIAAATAALVMFLRIREHGRFRWSLLKDYFTFALPLFVGSAITAIVSNIDSAALGFFLNEADLGVFGGVRRIVMVLAGVAPALGALLFPMFSGMMARGEADEAHRHLDQAIRFVSIFVLPPTVFTAVFADDVIRLTLSDEFLPGALVMGYLAFFVYVQTIAAPHANLLMGMGSQKLLVIIGGLTALSVIVLDVLLIPSDIRSLDLRLPGLGIEGAALGTLLSGVLYYLLVRIATARVGGYHPRARLWKHALASAVMAGALVALDRTVLALVHWYHFGAYVILGALVYFAALWALREFTKADWQLVRESVHPIEMIRYVREELRQRRK